MFSPDGEYVAVQRHHHQRRGRRFAVRSVARALGRHRPARAHADTPIDSEWQPQWSADGKWLAFLADRGGEDAKTQVWIMPAFGGEARKLTCFRRRRRGFRLVAGWQARLRVISPRSQAAGSREEKPKNRRPSSPRATSSRRTAPAISTARRKHLYLFDVAGAKATPLTSGRSR